MKIDEKSLKGARELCAQGKYVAAKKIYAEILQNDPKDLNGLLGMIRIASQNYTVYDGQEIEKAIAAARTAAGWVGKVSDREYDDYAAYAVGRRDASARREAYLKAHAGEFVVTGGVLKEYKGVGGEIYIPDGVKEIGDEVFRLKYSLTKVIFSDGVEKIGSYSFAFCRKLQEVTLPDGLTVLDQGAFSGCVSLEKIRLPQTLTKMDAYAFKDCKALTEIELPAGVKEIGQGVFEKCSPQLRVRVAAGNASFYIKGNCLIGKQDKTLYWAGGKFEIPSGGEAERIRCGAFTGREDLRSIAIPPGVKTLDLFAFKDCIALEEVSLPEGLEKIGDEGFRNCKSLRRLVIPSTVKEVGPDAFKGCESLKSILAPEGLSLIHCNRPAGCFVSRR